MSKKIQFNPELLNPKSGSSRKKPIFKRSESATITKLRRKILKQLNNNAKPATIKHSLKIKKDTEKSFDDTIKFLNKNLEPPVQPAPPIPAAPSHNPVAPKKFKSKISFEQVNLELPMELQEPPPRLSGAPAKTRKHIEPKYGCLKRGAKPTFQKTTTRRNISFNTDNNNIHEFDNTLPPTMNININDRSLYSPPPDLCTTPMVSPNEENISLDIEELPTGPKELDEKVHVKMDEINILDIIPENEIVEDINKNIQPSQPHVKCQKSGKTTQKMRLGKVGKKVCVLINDNTTRKNIRNEKHLLNITPIKKVKEYLKQNSLLEVGSMAPDDVLRSIYTNAKLSGELENKNGDVLLNNFIKGEGDDV